MYVCILVKYAEHLECFISCSTGKQNSVIVGFVEKASIVMRTTSFKYFHGVHCFDYHQKMNLIGRLMLYLIFLSLDSYQSSK